MRLAVSTVAISALFMSLATAGPEDVAYCDGCWCIPESGESCPTDSMPQIDFSEDLLNNLRTIPLENPMELTCNPYEDETCDTQPPLDEGGACVAEIIKPEDDSQQCPSQGYSYRLKTVASREEAENNGEIVTHEGACGTCSSFHDLAVWMSNPDLAEVGIRCTIRSIVNFTDGVACYNDEGFTDSCATTWIYNSLKTSASCPTCGSFAISMAPNNGDPPTCELAECLQCDEDESGPIFKTFSGRTRRGSGLLSAIVRPCSSITSLIHRDPCDDSTSAPSAAPTAPNSEAPTGDSGGTAVSSLLWLVLLSIRFFAV